MADESNGYFIPVSRKVFEHEFWEEKREFSKFEAWIDLIQSARFDQEIKSQWVNNKEVKFGRGQMIASFRFLQKRWNWGSISKVEGFLKVLKNKDMVVLETGQGINVVTICKYDTYNQIKNPVKTAKGQGTGQQKDETNKENKDNKEIKKKNSLAVTKLNASQAVEVYNSVKAYFNEIYAIEFDTEYYFEAKDGTKVYSIIKKVYSKVVEKSGKKEITPEVLVKAVNVFLNAGLTMADPWLKSNFNLSNIDSKFNDVFTQIKSQQNGSTKTRKSIFAD